MVSSKFDEVDSLKTCYIDKTGLFGIRLKRLDFAKLPNKETKLATKLQTVKWHKTLMPRIMNESTRRNGKTTRQIDITTRPNDFESTSGPIILVPVLTSYDVTKERNKISTKLQNDEWRKTFMLRIKNF